MQTATNPQTGEKVQWNGSAWVPVGAAPSAPAAPGVMTVGTPRPEKPQIRQVGNQLGVVDDQGNFTPTYTAPEKPEKPESSEADDVKIQQKRAALQSLETQINRVEELYRGGLKDEAFGMLSSLGEFLPTEGNRQFDAAAAGMAEQGLAAFRVPGVGAQSDTELRQFVQANKPTASDYDATIEEKLKQLRVRVDATRQEMGLPATQWLGQADQSRNLAEIEAPTQQRMAPATGGYQTVDNPELAGVRGEYLKRLAAGESASQIVAFLRRAGVTDPKIYQSVGRQVKYRRENPNVPIANYNTGALDDMDVPLSTTESMMNDAAQSPVGSYMMNAGQAASLNTLDELAPNQERAQLALQDSQFTNPISSTLGTISGGLMAALGGEAGLAARGMQAGIPRALIADSAFGVGTGAGAAEDGNRLSGAVTGGLAAGAGSLAGAGIMRAGGSIVSPSGGKLSGLYEQGVRPTPGQRLVEAGGGRGVPGLIGRTVNNIEENLGSVPVVGSAIRGARQDARDQWQIGAFNQALKEVGEKLPKGMKVGTGPHKYTQKVFDRVYDKARSGMRVGADDDLANQLNALGDEVGNLAEPSAKRFYTILENVVMRRVKGGALEGADYKSVQSEIGKVIRGIRKSQSGDGELADALESLQGSLDDAARRHSDPEAVKLLDDADRGYAKFVLIENAARQRGGDAGTFNPNQFDRAVQGMGSRVRSKSYLQGEGLMQDYAEAGGSLVDRIPNSGSPERIITATTLAGGAGFAEPTSLGLLGALGALYAPGVRKVTAGSMAPRGKRAKAIAQEMKKRARITGAVGAGVALSGQKDDDR